MLRRSGPFALMVLAMIALAFTGTSRPAAAACGDRLVFLEAGWNAAGWTGPRTAVATATANLTGQFDALLAWDPAAQRFRSYRPALPGALNDLTILEGSQAFWIHVTAPVRAIWQQPVDADVARRTAVSAGWNLLLWTGPSGTLSETAFGPAVFDAAPSPFEAAFLWVAAAGTYVRYSPRLPAALNDLAAMDYGDAVWLRSLAPGTYSIPEADLDC